MEIRRIKISQINPAPYNPRLDLKPGDPEYEKIKRSIEEFDLVEPLVWNERTGTLVGGHQRLKVLQERGDKEVEVSVVNLDEAKEKALNITLNKIQSNWDFPKLKDLFEDLNKENFDIEITGFNPELFDDIDYKELWKGMPEFKQDGINEYKILIVRFLNKEDYKRFSQIIKQKLTEKTKSIWFPKQDFDSLGRNLEFINEE